jgi:hypothetical protein
MNITVTAHTAAKIIKIPHENKKRAMLQNHGADVRNIYTDIRRLVQNGLRTGNSIKN